MKIDEKHLVTQMEIIESEHELHQHENMNKIDDEHHQHQQQHHMEIVENIGASEHLLDEIKFMPNEFLLHKSTFSGDFDNYDIWCVLDEQYLQKYEPVLLSTGERCHQSADIVRFCLLMLF